MTMLKRNLLRRRRHRRWQGALRIIPEKIEAFVDAQVIVASSFLSGRPDLAAAGIVALYRERVSANEQRIRTSE